MAIQIKRGTSAQRKVSEVVLEAGQPFLETDTGNLFIGKTGTEKLKDLTLDDCYLSCRTWKELDPKKKIYGVDLVGSQDPNALIRTDDAVGLNITVGTSEITSDFDNCYPWCDMKEVTDEFGNVFIKIPKFYSKITKNADGTYKHQLSGTKYEGFSTLFVDKLEHEHDYVLIGKYEGSGSSSRIYSKSGQTPLCNVKINEFRSGCTANGVGYQQYDYLIDLIIKELWLVEMKTTNCQSIMHGYTGSTILKTGTTDSVSTSSGSPASNTDGKHACKYRGIENPWGNVWMLCDGIQCHTNGISVCTQPELYSEIGGSRGYMWQGTLNFSSIYTGYLQKFEPLERNPLIQFTTSLDGASATTYFCTMAGVPNTGNILTIRGTSLWGFHPEDKEYVFTRLGGRLCYKPLV